MVEPHDDSPRHFTLWNDALEFFRAAAEFYKNVVKESVEAIDSDPDLKAILGEEERRSFEIHRELESAEAAVNWLDDRLKSGKKHHFMFVQHSSVRFLKATGLLYMKQLQKKRNALASKPLVAKHALEAIDSRLEGIREILTSGVFGEATAIQLLAEDALQDLSDTIETDSGREESLRKVSTPRAIALESIQFLDSEIRSRCLDLFNKFEQEGERDRFDTVVREATSILEDKLRKISGAPDTVTGVDLAKYAFGGPSPVLLVSDVPAEQDAVHLLVRGVFGFVRNVVHHRLLGELQPARVMQELGMIDYCIAIAKGAKRRAFP